MRLLRLDLIAFGPFTDAAFDFASPRLADADAGKPISLPTKRWKLAALALQHLPRGAVRAITRQVDRARN